MNHAKQKLREHLASGKEVRIKRGEGEDAIPEYDPKRGKIFIMTFGIISLLIMAGILITQIITSIK